MMHPFIHLLITHALFYAFPCSLVVTSLFLPLYTKFVTMKKVLIALSLAVFIFSGISAQQTMELTFTAIDSVYYSRLDSIKVMNRTKECDTILHWNDTVLVLDVNVGMPEQEINKEFNVKAYPNPVMEVAILNVVIPEAAKTEVTITNFQGRIMHAKSFSLNAGLNVFNFIPGREKMYFISFSWQGHTRHLKLINASPVKARESVLNYFGGHNQVGNKMLVTGNGGFKFTPGDRLLYIGYIDSLESGIADVPMESKAYTFQFAYNIPCIDTPFIIYSGVLYYTSQIFSQCWLKRNLDIGIMIPGLQEMEDNEIIEKYCYDDNIENCFTYGGLYQWNEVMNYNIQEGGQGLCPDGWHVPTDEEYKILAGAVDSQYGIGDTIWDQEYTYRGFDAGYHLKASDGWYGGYNGSDKFGFNAMPCGRRRWEGVYNTLGTVSWVWSSSTYNTYYGWYKEIHYKLDNLGRYFTTKLDGLGVRCIKN